ncbi:MAG TPA: SMC-Scp complex subunit ScpB [Gammaproteobacteria bacterium]|nr:SMC-Scp complex subunit ScpB [Gammaproteobacteria bacterium]
MDLQKIKIIVEAALLAAARPLSMNELDEVFALPENPQPRPSRDEIRQALDALRAEYEGRGIELKQVGSGFRIQVTQDYEPWMARLWQEKPPRYSRALLETLAIIAYRQPITRGEIEEIRGVSVSANITRTLQEREWVKVVGHRDVPGKPALFGTTREFLDYFNLKSLDELPTLAELKDLDSLYPELDLEGDRTEAVGDADTEPAAAPSSEEAKLTVIEGGEEGETLH